MKILWKFQEKWRKLTWTSTLPSWREVCVQNSPCLRGWARAHLRTNPSQLAYWGWAWECFLSKAEPYTIDMSRNYAWRLHVFSIPGFGIGVLWASSCQFSNDFSEILVITLVLCMRRMRATEAIGSLRMTKGVGHRAGGWDGRFWISGPWFLYYYSSVSGSYLQSSRSEVSCQVCVKFFISSVSRIPRTTMETLRERSASQQSQENHKQPSLASHIPEMPVRASGKWLRVPSGRAWHVSL